MQTSTSISIDQIRAARAMLRMSAEALVAQHEKNLQATTLAKEGRHPTNVEIPI